MDRDLAAQRESAGDASKAEAEKRAAAEPAAARLAQEKARLEAEDAERPVGRASCTAQAAPVAERQKADEADARGRCEKKERLEQAKAAAD